MLSEITFATDQMRTQVPLQDKNARLCVMRSSEPVAQYHPPSRVLRHTAAFFHETDR